MKRTLLVTLLATCSLARADCASTLPVQGFQSINSCSKAGADCVDADEALYQYVAAHKDEGPQVLSVSLHGSPWHLYGPDYHIMEIDELAALVRQQGDKIKHVVLHASWSGVAPDKQSKSLAQKLSDALKGMKVTGQNGFVWFSKEGKVSTTRQAFSGYVSGPYRIKKGDKLMASLVAGWPAGLEADFAKRQDGQGLMRAGAGADIFMLCPEGALRAFDASAALSNPIGAYNAAIMRLERGHAGDEAAAITLLEKSAASGDKKAQAKLSSLAAKKPR
jgi:hypothetical protein